MPEPDAPLALARQLRAAGRLTDAVACLKQALRTSPQEAALHLELGNVLRALGRHQEALAPLAEAIDRAPGEPACRLNMGVTLLEMGAAKEALEHFEQAVILAPTLPEAYNILGCAELELGRLASAENTFGKALKLRPEYAAAHDNLGRCLKAQGRIQEALEAYDKALLLKPNASTGSNALLAANYHPCLSPENLTRRHLSWAQQYASTTTNTPKLEDEALLSRLRIGYVSPDFCNHAVAFFILPILRHHDRSRFEVTCYHAGKTVDATTHLIQSQCEQWRDISRMTDAEATRCIREDGIQILVDLAGHTANNRLGIFAQRAAPLQITWIGYPNTTGLPTMDARISDARCIPPQEERLHGPEEILRHPDVFCCYEPPTAVPSPLDLPPDSHEGPTQFCSFNNLAKLSEPCLQLWMRLLKAVPSSVLYLRGPGFDDLAAALRIESFAKKAGIPSSRLRLDGRRLPMREHLECYNLCQVALDPFPYNGTTTTCEALLMGVPVIALEGKTPVSRVGANFLRTLHLDELIAQDEDDYLEKACNLARDLPRLASLRAGLRQRLLKSPLTQADAFTHKYESMLLQFVARHSAALEQRRRAGVPQSPLPGEQ